MSDQRFCFTILTSQRVDGRGYVPSVVFEGEPGHAPLIGRDRFSEPWYWGSDQATAERVCREANEKLGLTESDVTDIIISSIAAGNLADSERAERQQRMWDLFATRAQKENREAEEFINRLFSVPAEPQG